MWLWLWCWLMIPVMVVDRNNPFPFPSATTTTTTTAPAVTKSVFDYHSHYCCLRGHRLGRAKSSVVVCCGPSPLIDLIRGLFRFSQASPCPRHVRLFLSCLVRVPFLQTYIHTSIPIPYSTHCSLVRTSSSIIATKSTLTTT